MVCSAKDLRLERVQVIEAARSIMRNAEYEGREPRGEERSNFDLAMNKADDLADAIDQIERLEAAERSLAAGQGRYSEPGQPGHTPGSYETRGGARSTPEYRAAFDAFLRGGFSSLGHAE